MFASNAHVFRVNFWGDLEFQGTPVAWEELLSSDEDDGATELRHEKMRKAERRRSSEGDSSLKLEII